MQSALVQLAQEIVKGGERGPEANQQFRSLINEVGNLNECLYVINQSDNYLFVYCSNMIKLIENGEFSIISETKSEENIVDLTESGNNCKVKVYGQIISCLVEILLRNNKPNHIRRSVIDLIAICLKTLFEDNSFFSFMQKAINLFVPSYMLVQSFNTTTETNLQFIIPRYGLDFSNLANYCTLVEIMISMFEYVTVQTSAKTYYEYRRSIYVFRNSYLAFFLYFAVQNCKIIFQAYDSSEAITIVMRTTIQLLESIFMYPFTLSLHQFEIQEDSADNISGSGTGEIYFPNYYRHIICDALFLENLYKYCEMVIQNQQTYQSKRKQINSLIKILGRACCASQYTFKNDDEKQISRQFSIKLIQSLCVNYRYADSYYLNTIMDILNKMVTMYDFYFSANRQTIIDTILSFLYKILHEFEIIIEEGKKSPLARTFQLLSICIEYTKDKMGSSAFEALKVKSQKILEKVYERMLSPEADAIVRKFGYNHPTEIQCFSEIFDNILPAFELNLEENLAFFQNVNIFSFSAGISTMWLHLCCQLLPKTSASLEQTKIILKYYELAKNGDSLASLRYIRTLVEEVMGQFRDGEPCTSIWVHIEEISRVGFKNFVSCILQICTRNFETSNNQILDYSLQLFKTIYTSLKKNEHRTFQEFYQVVHKLLQGINETIFANPKYYHKRRDFFNVISVIWINSNTISYIYEIHDLIVSKLESGTPESFFQYLHDITGLIEPLDLHQAFEVLTELAIEDLNRLFSLHFSDANKVALYFSDQMFMKIFCKLVYALISDINRKLFFETHTKIPLKIHNLIFPIIKILAQGGFEYSKRFTNILEKMVSLHPLCELVPFPNIVKALQEQSIDDFQKLVRVYFEHIHRVADISWMFELIQNSVDNMVSWWEEAMIRNMHPKVNFRIIAESRFWATTRQKEGFAKLLFELGYYDKSYWAVEPNIGERAFVEDFCKQYS